MRKITDAVREIVQRSDVAQEAMRLGVLNQSAYAELILPEVERLTWKDVQKNSVVVSLSRVARELEEADPLKPSVVIQELSIKAPLADLTFERSEHNLLKVHQLPSKLHFGPNQFLTITQGINEITVIVSQDRAEEVLAHIDAPTRSIFRDLVGITIKFDPQYLDQPNVIYALLAKLAYQRINLLEIVSTYTELTVLIEERDLDKAVSAFGGTT